MKKFGLVLSGGGARGLAHIGVLKVLEDNGIKPDYISGASMGAIVGGVYASGVTVEKMEDFVRDFVFGDVLDKKSPLRTMQLFEKTSKKFMKYFSVGLSINSLVKKRALDSGRKIQYMFKQLTGNKYFSELKIPFACTATDILSGKSIVLDKGKVYMAMRASMSIPLIFEAVKYDNMFLVDGGVANNIPSFIVRDMGAEVVIAIDVNPPLESKEEKDIKTPIDMLWRTYQITLDNLYRKELKEADYVVNAHTNGETLDFSDNMHYIKAGEDAMKKNIDKIKELLEV